MVISSLRIMKTRPSALTKHCICLPPPHRCVAKSLDVDYVLVIFGGVTGYSSDDINKFLWPVRIGSGVFPDDMHHERVRKDTVDVFLSIRARCSCVLDDGARVL